MGTTSPPACALYPPNGLRGRHVCHSFGLLLRLLAWDRSQTRRRWTGQAPSLRSGWEENGREGSNCQMGIAQVCWSPCSYPSGRYDYVVFMMHGGVSNIWQLHVITQKWLVSTNPSLNDVHQRSPYQNLHPLGCAGFSLCFHLPRGHFGYICCTFF